MKKKNTIVIITVDVLMCILEYLCKLSSSEDLFNYVSLRLTCSSTILWQEDRMKLFRQTYILLWIIGFISDAVLSIKWQAAELLTTAARNFFLLSVTHLVFSSRSGLRPRYRRNIRNHLLKVKQPETACCYTQMPAGVWLLQPSVIFSQYPRWHIGPQ